ncbi:MAG: protein-glutamate O-methyltransferase CheR [Desulfobacterales bacterium]|nr:protein-glutamate O-methyltransferase CheR [Desulfobacterales bacterium]
MNLLDLSDADFRRFSALVYEKCGICLHEGKKELVRARLGKRLRATGLENFKDYYKFLTKQDDGDELVQMLDAISTNVTSFFREQKHFDFLKETVFPSYEAGRNGTRPRRLRFWSAGCSTGEEPYSLAMWFQEYFGHKSGFDMRILATDISANVLARAQQGVYPAGRLKGVPQMLIRKYFQRGYGKQEGYFRVKESVRQFVDFRRFNLMEPFTFKDRFDLILCRNVMIYFDKGTQEMLVNKFHDCLENGGHLLIGGSESLTGSDHPFKYIRPSTYQKQ